MRESELFTHTVLAEEQGTRLDKLLPQLPAGLSRSAAAKLLEEGNVLVNGNAVKDKNYRLRLNDSIELNLPAPKPLEVEAQPIELDIVYEDNDLIVVNKPKGMVVHPAAGNPDNTLVNALLHHCGDSLSGINGVMRPGIVHRIDKDTSGLLIVAKNDTAHRSLAAQIKEHSFTRIYEAVVIGNLRDESGSIDAPIGRHPAERKRMAVTNRNSKNAVTHYEVLARYPGYTHVRLRLETGRTHQIRVHMAHIGHPVAGDMVYGPKKPLAGLNGQCLHAKVIGFIHPSTGEYLQFDSPLPDWFTQFIDRISR